MAATENNGINWEKIFGTSIKITVPYIIGITVGSKYMEHNIGWIDVMTQGILAFCVCYLSGALLNGIYNIINTQKNKQLPEHQNNQNGR